MKYIIILSLAVIMLFSSCKDDPTEPVNDNPPANQVWMRGNTFVPASLTVTRGTVITWVNKDGVLHTATSSSAGSFFDSGNLSKDQTFSFTFDSTGTFTYYCKLHEGMTGNIIVQ